MAGQDALSHSTSAASIQSMAEQGAEPRFEAPYGPLMASQYALVARRHMHEYGTTPEQLAAVAVALRRHANLNPNAHKREPITVHDVLGSRYVSDPLHLLDCSLVSDGAAAVIVTSTARARTLRQPLVELLGQGYAVGPPYVGDARDITTTAATQSGSAALKSAGVKAADIDVAELYDCFTITVIIELEDLGFCAKGEGGCFVESGGIQVGGRLPVSTHGGLLSGGHPGLAGGLFHAVEAARQLRRQAGDRQVDNCQLALVHGNGGTFAIHSTIVLAAGK